MKKRVNIIIGRFQPFTKGHKAVVERMFDENQLPCVIFYISSKTRDARHPFTDATVKKVITESFNNDKKLFADCFPARSADIVHIGEVLYANGYEAVLFGCGADRAVAYKKQVDNPKYRERGHYTDEFQVFELSRDESSADIDGVSATKVRRAIKDGDFNSFRNMTSFGSEAVAKSAFEKLKSEIDSVSESRRTITLAEWVNECRENVIILR